MSKTILDLNDKVSNHDKAIYDIQLFNYYCTGQTSVKVISASLGYATLYEKMHFGDIKVQTSNLFKFIDIYPSDIVDHTKLKKTTHRFNIEKKGDVEGFNAIKDGEYTIDIHLAIAIILGDTDDFYFNLEDFYLGTPTSALTKTGYDNQ